MAFNSYSYLLLLAPLALCYWLIPTAWRKWFLLAVGLAFYASWNPVYVALPLVVSFVAWWCARQIEADKAKSGKWVWRGSAVVLALLVFFKYSGFLWQSATGLTGAVSPLPAWLALALPLGISFYVFEAIGLLIDARQGRIRNLSLLDVCTMITFWPCMTSGPILRFREISSQWNAKRRFEPGFVLDGVERILLGLVQKNLIANSLGSVAAEGFLPKASVANSSVDNWVMAIAYGLQVYFDFASYTNMALGSARLLGFTLPENFRFPYHAANPSDFWSRWHMSLSRWIRDYLFFPINARYKGAALPLYASLIGIMALVGLWHGAGWGFVAWGVMHGLYLVVYRIWESLAERHPGWGDAIWARWGWRLLTLAAVAAAWVPFRTATLGQAARMLKSMLFSFDLRLSYNVNTYLITMLAVALCALEPLLDALQQRWIKRCAAGGWPLHLRMWIWRPVMWSAALLLFLIFDDRDTQFIYFQF